MYRSRARAIAEAALAAALFAVLMTVGATGLAVVSGLPHPIGISWWDHAGSGLALMVDPVFGLGVAGPLWLAAIVLVAQVTRAAHGRFGLFLAAGVTVVVAVLGLMVASVAALIQGQAVVSSLRITMVTMLLFLLAAITSLVVVHFVVFRDRHHIPSYISAGERSFTRAA